MSLVAPRMRQTFDEGPSFHGLEARRYLRFARLASDSRKRVALIRLAADHARRAWHAVLAMEGTQS